MTTAMAAAPAAKKARSLTPEQIAYLTLPVFDSWRGAVIETIVRGFSHEDAAAALGCNKITVRTSTYRTRAELRRLIDDAAPLPDIATVRLWLKSEPRVTHNEGGDTLEDALAVLARIALPGEAGEYPVEEKFAARILKGLLTAGPRGGPRTRSA